MELNIEELRAKVKEQEAARTEEFKKRLEADNERENKEHEKLQALLKKAGEKAVEEKRAAMEAQIDTAMEHAKTEIKAEYAQKHGLAECDNQREPLKKMLNALMSGK